MPASGCYEAVGRHGVAQFRQCRRIALAGRASGYDLSAVAETVDEPLLQRMGLVTEFSIEPEQVRLRGLTGRIGSDQLELDA